MTEERSSGLGINGLLLLGVLLVILTTFGLAFVLYVLPREPLSIPKLQPAVRVGTDTEIPTGSSRIVSWGDDVILVVRAPDRFYALEGTSPFDGCILRWEDESSRVVSPCSNVVYDLRGNVVLGLSTAPLRPYGVVVRDGIVYVTES
jgi:nitrite reductase/ring-hydroxylating ferredoxin subunit